MLTFRLRFYPSPCLTLELYIATIATLVNNKKHFFYFFFGTNTEIRGTSNQMNNCSDKERPPVGGSGGRLVTEQLFGSLGRFRSMRRSRPDPEQLFRRAARPRKGPATCCKSSRASRGGIPRSYPDPEARCQPRPRSRTILLKLPMQRPIPPHGARNGI